MKEVFVKIEENRRVEVPGNPGAGPDSFALQCGEADEFSNSSQPSHRAPSLHVLNLPPRHQAPRLHTFNSSIAITTAVPYPTMTSTRSSKRQRADTTTDSPSSPPFELLYWPTIPGRGEHIRLAFEATGTPYLDTCNTTKDGTSTLLSHIHSSDTPRTHPNPPPFAPPILKHGDALLSQTPNILLYLGPLLSLVPEISSDPIGLYHVNALALTALDGLSNEPHDVHHPVGASLYYEDQKEEALRKAQDYRENRLPKFLEYFERVLKCSRADGGTGEWLYGDQMTYADLVLFQTLDGVNFAFPKCCGRARKSGKYENVYALYDRVKALPKIKAYLESDRRQAYSNGIYRHYPELDHPDEE
jgi:glutathione S-transferase